MINRIGKFGIALAATLVALGGCGGPVAPPPDSRPLGAENVRETSTQLAVTPAEAELVEPNNDTNSATSAVSAPISAEQFPEMQLEASAFDPPYPDRSDLFRPPGVEQSVRATNGEEEMPRSEIQLLGFIGEEPRRAVLSYNGQVRRLLEGGQLGGVEVVSMHEDDVTLRRGRVQWTLSLLD